MKLTLNNKVKICPISDSRVDLHFKTFEKKIPISSNWTSNMISTNSSNWKLTLTLDDVKSVRFQIQPSICIQDSMEKLPTKFFLPFATHLDIWDCRSIDRDFEAESSMQSRSIRHQSIVKMVNTNGSCMLPAHRFSIYESKKKPNWQRVLEKPSRIDVSTVHHHHHHHHRPATFVLGMLALSWSHQIAGWLVQRILYSIAKPTPISGGGTTCVSWLACRPLSCYLWQ